GRARQERRDLEPGGKAAARDCEADRRELVVGAVGHEDDEAAAAVFGHGGSPWTRWAERQLCARGIPETFQATVRSDPATRARRRLLAVPVIALKRPVALRGC